MALSWWLFQIAWVSHHNAANVQPASVSAVSQDLHWKIKNVKVGLGSNPDIQKIKTSHEWD